MNVHPSDWEQKLIGLSRRMAVQSVPFASTSYIGHMNHDLLTAAVVGQVVGMLHNSNLVAQESSPVATELETRVISELGRMVGLEPSSLGGFLTTGGSSSNLTACSLALSVKTFPASLALGLRGALRLPPASLARLASRAGVTMQVARSCLEAGLRTVVRGRPLGTWSPRELIALGGPRVVETFLADVLATMSNLDDGRARELLNEAIEPFRLSTLGLAQFLAFVDPTRPVRFRIYASEAAHYSVTKAAKVLGLGGESVRLVPERDHSDFSMDGEALQEMLALDIEQGDAPLLVVSTVGTTEVGALDRTDELDEVRRAVRDERGHDLWLHADAAYGGYFASMLRTTDGSASGDLTEYLSQVARASGVEDWPRLDSQEHDDRMHRALRSLSQADSVSIDPHKLGYVPYAVGALLVRDRAHLGFLVQTRAAYLWNDDGDDEHLSTGQLSIEGSRAGAGAVSCAAAHDQIPLDRDNHGRLLARTMIAARALAQEIREAFEGATKVRVSVLPVQTNILVYFVYPSGGSLEDAERLTERFARVHHPTHEPRADYLVVSTRLRLSIEALRALAPDLALPEDDSSKREVLCLRSVVMDPSLAEQSEARRGYATYLRQTTDQLSDTMTGGEA